MSTPVLHKSSKYKYYYPGTEITCIDGDQVEYKGQPATVVSANSGPYKGKPQVSIFIPSLHKIRNPLISKLTFISHKIEPPQNPPETLNIPPPASIDLAFQDMSLQVHTPLELACKKFFAEFKQYISDVYPTEDEHKQLYITVHVKENHDRKLPKEYQGFQVKIPYCFTDPLTQSDIESIKNVDINLESEQCFSDLLKEHSNIQAILLGIDEQKSYTMIICVPMKGFYPCSETHFPTSLKTSAGIYIAVIIKEAIVYRTGIREQVINASKRKVIFPGIAIGPKTEESSGTLGGFFTKKDESPGQGICIMYMDSFYLTFIDYCKYFLTNMHVACPSNREPSDIVSPSNLDIKIVKTQLSHPSIKQKFSSTVDKLDKSSEYQLTLGTFNNETIGANENKTMQVLRGGISRIQVGIDAAFIKLNTNNIILDLHNPMGDTFTSVSRKLHPSHTEVCKYGRSTEFTQAMIAAPELYVKDQSEFSTYLYKVEKEAKDNFFYHQIPIYSRTKSFCEPGDSGSIVYVENGEVIGLLHATLNSGQLNVTAATPIQFITEYYGMKLLTEYLLGLEFEAEDKDRISKFLDRTSDNSGIHECVTKDEEVKFIIHYSNMKGDTEEADGWQLWQKKDDA